MPTTYTYDARGNQLTVTDATGTTTRVYDTQGRVLSKTTEIDGEAFTQTFIYDLLTNPVTNAPLPQGHTAETAIDPKGNVTSKEYDKTGRLVSVFEGSDVTTYQYYSNGALKRTTYPGNTYSTYSYYLNHLLEGAANHRPNGNYISTYTYGYDPNGNLLQKLDAQGLTTYTYDHQDRLETLTEPTGRVTEYTYDLAGNRATETKTEGEETTVTISTYNAQNRLMHLTEERPDGTVKENAFYYDPNGNMLSKFTSYQQPEPPNNQQPEPPNNQQPEPPNNPIENQLTETSPDVTLYTYDTRNRLVTTSYNETITQSVYNGENRRIKQTVNDETTLYIYEYNKVVLELTEEGAQKAKNTYGNALISRKNAGESVVYFLYNGQGDVEALSNANGNTVATYYYNPWGKHL